MMEIMITHRSQPLDTTTLMEIVTPSLTQTQTQERERAMVQMWLERLECPKTMESVVLVLPMDQLLRVSYLKDTVETVSIRLYLFPRANIILGHIACPK